MCHCLLRHHVQKKILFRRTMYQKDIERTSLKKLTELISGDMEKIAQNLFLMPATLQILKNKQVKTLKSFDMEPKEI